VSAADNRYNRSDKGRARHRRYARRRYERLKDEGLCTKCGAEPAFLSVKCVYCASKQALYELGRVRIWI
jgi:hypothetical protein